MRMQSLGTALVVGLVLPIALHAQPGRITGVVTPAAGRPVYRAQVSVPGTQLGALTDSLGHYRITSVPAGPHTVRAASLGYAPQTANVTVTANGTATADFTLPTLAIALQQMVVVGYGTQRKGEVTGSVAQVNSEDFIKGPARDAASLIAGKVAGLGVITPSGDPRSGTQIMLRGITTIQGNTSPLVLIDGVPGGLNTVSPSDIESISVLKDGSAPAVYGSRASNGVILITTKKHEGGKATMRYDGYAAQQSIYKRPDFLTADDYRRLNTQRYKFEDLGGNTDWQAQILRSNPTS